MAAFDLPALLISLSVPAGMDDHASRQKVRAGAWKSCQARGAQMVDLALPLGYHGTFRRLASVKLIGPRGPDEARLAVQQFTQRFGTSTTTRHVVLPTPEAGSKPLRRPD